MHKSLLSFYPDPDEVLALAPNDLGDLILSELWGHYEKLNRNNSANDMADPYPRDYRDRISRAALEAWSWLVNQQFIAETNENGWFFVTRRGDERREMLVRLRDEAANPPHPLDIPLDEFAQTVKTVQQVPQIRDETIFDSTVGDQPAQDDALGFEPYVKAMADFLTNPLTIPPLTISIEGDWGTGKSSFMTQLEQLLLERGSLTIRFNAWRHDKHEELWAAFALELIRQISARQRFWRRWMANLELRCKRFDLAEGWLDFARATAIWFCMIVAAISLPILLVFKGSDWLRWLSGVISDGSIIGQLTTWSVALGGAGALAVAFASLFLKLRSVLGNPVAIDLRKYLRSPKYEDRVAFIEDFHRDLERIVRSYAGTRKVVVFVDDLDRCEVPKAAELMQAINLMIANDPQLIFVVGMDREKIAAGIAVKQEKLIPFVTNSLDEQDATSLEAALYYGYRFIEKFIQVPFTVPVATVDDVQRFFQRLNSCSPEAGAEVKWWRGITQRFFANKRVPLEARVGSVGAPRVREDTQQRQQRLKLITGNAETEAVQQIVLMAAELLEKNPRRIKQFINLFRLRAHIANETGLFDVMTGAEPPETVTLEQLGKFVAITQMHPRLLVDLENDSRLLSKLQRIAEGDTLPPGARKSLEFWANNPKLIAFLRFGVIDGPTEDPDRFTLAKLDVNKLLAISPRVHRPSSTEA